MWEAPGRAYTYLIHGKYYLLNLVTEAEGQPGAVLLRAIEPLEGLEVMAQHRAGRPRHEWTSGPGRLTLALHIGAGENRVDMRGPESGLWIEGDMSYPDEAVSRGPRIGMGKNLPEPWLSAPLRWWVSSHPDVSRGK
jgi:DNA-3-methyladenine glycosylase